MNFKEIDKLTAENEKRSVIAVSSEKKNDVVYRKMLQLTSVGKVLLLFQENRT